ncbi:MAG: electron transfer flavoprotein subunit alpha/FixB family protein [Desulfobacterales bacterium]|jgi:electron transfer flavoprotein alpha subunit
MARQIFAYILHKGGVADDSAQELSIAARKLDPEATVTAVVGGAGEQLAKVCEQAAAIYPEVWKIDNEALGYINAEVIRPMLARIIPAGAVTLVPHEHFGMDLAPGLSIKLNAAYLPDVVGFEGLEGGRLNAVREEFSGQVSTHVSCDISAGAVITVRPGAFQPQEGQGAGGRVVDKSGEAGTAAPRRRYLETVVAEVGDVDITKSEILVSVGRGIEDQDNLEIILELAKAVGGDVSCSRPIVDAKWLEKARQVGTSGQTVKPKVYMALGISGSFQHLGGIKGAPFMVAVNKNPKAPIFQVADVGVVADILEFVPELTEKINESK